MHYLHERSIRKIEESPNFQHTYPNLYYLYLYGFFWSLHSHVLLARLGCMRSRKSDTKFTASLAHKPLLPALQHVAFAFFDFYIYYTPLHNDSPFTSAYLALFFLWVFGRVSLNTFIYCLSANFAFIHIPHICLPLNAHVHL